MNSERKLHLVHVHFEPDLTRMPQKSIFSFQTFLIELKITIIYVTIIATKPIPREFISLRGKYIQIGLMFENYVYYTYTKYIFLLSIIEY